ncbi:MAG: SAF domain-containing protein, partial [Ilumatobacteraceae bacterium]
WQRRVIAMCAGFASVVFLISIIHLQTQRQRLAANFTAFVATRDIASGEPVTNDLVRSIRVPASLIAATTVTDLGQSSYAKQDIGVGEQLTSTNIAEDLSSIASIPDGWRTIAITSSTPLPPMSPGDRVDVIANGVVLVSNAVVVSTSGELSSKESMIAITFVIIGVPAESAPQVATAASLGDATLVVAP